MDEMLAALGTRLVEEHPDVELGRIFHSNGLKTHDRFFAFVARGDLIVKLPADRVRDLLATGAGQPFDAGKGRPMREWVRLRPPDETAFAAYVSEAYRFLASIEGSAGTPAGR